MRGEVIYYDETQGFGFLSGADGNRYTFARENLRRQAPMEKGTVVEFQPSGGQARDIFSVRAQIGSGASDAPTDAPPVAAVSAESASPASPLARTASAQHFGRAAESGFVRSIGLWSYFWRGLTANYFNFAGRARRKEYWGYYLFWVLTLFVIATAGFAIDAAQGNLDGNAVPLMAIGLVVVWVLGTFLPSLAITIRRIHDIGLSGWLYLLVFIPTLGALIILVFSLIPTQKNENKWGAVPDGVRL